MMSKAQLQQTIKDFPEKFTLEELMDKLILLDKIERGLKDSDEGKTISQEELEEEMKKWFE